MILRHFLLCTVAACATAAAVPMDVVFEDNGNRTVGRVSGFDTLFLELRTLGDPPVVQVPITNVVWVEFGEAGLVESFLAKPEGRQADVVERYFKERVTLLDVPGSSAGAFALRLAELLLDQETMVSRRRALELLDLIAAKDWDRARRERAIADRLRTLVLLDRPMLAIDEAEALVAGDSPVTTAAAHIALGEAAALRLGEISPGERRTPGGVRLLHATVAHFLFASTNPGALPELAALGMARASDVLREAGHAAESRRLLADLAKFFPETSAAQKAAGQLKEANDDR